MDFKSVGEGVVIGAIVFALTQVAFHFYAPPISYLSAFQPTISSTPTPTSFSPSPSRLLIPQINLDSPIERVGLASDGRMATPSVYTDVGWYEYGPKPGEIGNAVIDGHYDDPNGPSVFYKLRTLKIGDKIQVIDTSGRQINFQIYNIQSYLDSQFPLDLVFGSTTTSNLNLITCSGVFDHTDQNYSRRLVIFTHWIP